eukprot:6651674-Pyramimonas_sp.AAC.1
MDLNGGLKFSEHSDAVGRRGAPVESPIAQPCTNGWTRSACARSMRSPRAAMPSKATLGPVI